MKKIFLLFCCVLLSSSEFVRCDDGQEKNSDSQVRAPFPAQIVRCLTNFNIVRCLKYFLLLRLESKSSLDIDDQQTTVESFFKSIFKQSNEVDEDITKTFQSFNEEELNAKLTEKILERFKERPIIVSFIPNMLLKIVPSNSDDIELTVKKINPNEFTGRKTKSPSNDSDEEIESEDQDHVKADEASDKQALRRKAGLATIGLPLAFAPAMVFFGILPFLIPVLKMATAITSIVNLTALIASIFYLGRQHALEREMHQTVYFNSGFKEHHHKEKDYKPFDVFDVRNYEEE